jgi:pimeloyl-ACP methyl ester carboxylesterase
VTDVTLVHKHRTLHVRFGNEVARVVVRHWHPQERTGPRKLLIAVHGMAGTGLDFRYLALRLAVAGWHVVVPDLPGHGSSTWFGRTGAYALSDMASVLSALCKAFDATDGEACFIGSSMGSGLIAGFLAAYRIPAKAVILNDNALGFDPNLQRYIAHMRAEPQFFATREAAEAQLAARNRDLFGQADDHQIDPDTMQRYLNARIVARDGGFRFAFDRTFIETDQMREDRYPDFTEIIAGISAQRIMLMFGEHSPFRTSPVVPLVQEKRPDIVCQTVAGAGHAPRLMTPQQVDIVRRFLERDEDAPRS